jgi:hypothetical protein
MTAVQMPTLDSTNNNLPSEHTSQQLLQVYEPTECHIAMVICTPFTLK